VVGLRLLYIFLLYLSDRRLSHSQFERSRAQSTYRIGLLTPEHRHIAYLRTIYILTQVRIREERSMCCARYELDLDMYPV